ncbi:non-ribosomal peptide synthetase [Streptomyces sp. NPDC054794]
MKHQQPGRPTVPQLVRAVGAQFPQAVAVECGGEHLTYAELWRRAGSVAMALHGLPDFRPGNLVATLLRRGARNIVSQLGVWRAGGAYLPLDPALPDTRVRTILDDARPRAVIVDDGLGARLPEGTVTVDPDAAGLPEPPDAHGDLAYVIYTSGSTGTPKGVEVGHASLANLVAWHRDTYRTAPGVRVAALAGLGFDASAWEVWSALASGATLVLPSGLHSADVDAVRDFLDAEQVEQCFLSTPLAEQIVTLARPPRALRVLTTGGDRLRVSPPAGFPAAVYNHYGPTEATVVTTAGDDLRGAGADLPPIGRPIMGAQVRLVQAGRTVTEPDVEGELFIGGEILALGYRHDEVLTAKKFPYEADGSRWYASGDICRWDRDGQLRFVGRQDGQVSLRGHRIELAEIEHVLLGRPGVDQAKAIVRADQDGGTLAAYYCGTAEEGEVRSALANTLPRHMLPAVLLRLDRMPLNNSGKIDARALESLEADTEDAPAAGADAVLETVTGIWADLLGHRPRPGDHFFEIGGHSLMAARVTGRVRERLGVQIALDALFDAPVLADYARRVAADAQGM